MKKKLTHVSILVSIIILSGCGNKKDTDNESWAVKMANTVLVQSHDSLIRYAGGRSGWSYDVAFLGMAIDKLGKTDKKFSKYMEDWVNYFVQPDGSIIDYNIREYNLDRINPGKDIITVYRRYPEEKYRIAVDSLAKQLNNHPKTHSGGYWHKKVYPWQMWLDGIYMASPFMAQYAEVFGKPEWFDVATAQTKMIYEKTLDQSSGLLMHAWDESKSQKWCDPETGRSHYPWSRAMGWYTMAIVDILDYLPANHPDRQALTEILQKTCDALLKVQDPATGLWYQVLDQGTREGNYLEGSGSAMFIYVFAKGAKLGYLDEKYLDIANKSFDGYLKTLVTTDDKGMVTIHNIVGGCGLGGNPYRDGSYEYYISERRADNDTKGVAPFILAALELNR